MTTPTADIVDIALHRQRVQLARQVRAEADAHDRAGADPHFVAGLRHAAALVRDGRSRPSEAS